ncbi:biotin--protein ligase 2 isoform X1 [Cryptomeria japonica]|uniref:biotin--protein ligase 2 isoform X1 n=3 Tax=Cryptomeria japonica TaxID=3369 RepID=UPI0025ABA49C|nr:biotin--protein ligase 2 isoform X1 [Cryptomeria japonica]XP_057816098.1 biotin--protein ligase 2 isoform X1 [Cryptomeria japonica]
MLGLKNCCTSWVLKSNHSCRGDRLLSLNWIRVSPQIVHVSPLLSVSLSVSKDTATFFFTWPWKFNLCENFWKGDRRMEIRETSAIDMHLCNRGNSIASGICQSNDGLLESTCNTDTCQVEGVSSPKEGCTRRQYQLEKSSSEAPSDNVSSAENSISLMIAHADSSVELQYIEALKQENGLKLPNTEVVVTARSLEHITSYHEFFDIDLYMNNLSTNQFGRLLIWSPRLPSTHTLLSQNFHAFPLGTACVADTQFQGKGRVNNLWESPVGCMMFSFTLAMENGRVLPLLQYVVSLAVIEAIERVCETKCAPIPNVRIKWPNDIYANGLKVGGVLCTSTYSSKKFSVTIGIGLNLDNEKPTTCLNALLQDLTSYSHLIRREELLAAFFGRFEVLLDIFLRQGFSTLESKYYDKWLHSGQRVLLEERDQQNLGPSNVFVTVKGLTSSGYLLATDDENNKYELHPDGNSFDFFKGLVRKKFAE